MSTGFTGVFGRLITYDAFVLVYIRFIIAGLAAYAFVKITHKLVKVSFKDKLRFMFTGALLTLHLIFFYLSIKLSNVSIGTITLASASFFTAILEPRITGAKFKKKNLLFSLLNILGLLLIFNLDTKYQLGIAVGMVGALLSSLYALFNGRYSHHKEPNTVVTYQMLGGFALVNLLAPFYLVFMGTENLYYNGMDLFYLFILATVLTVFLYFLVVGLSNKISAFTLSLTFNLEPIWAIVFVMVIFHEQSELNFSFYIGLVLMISSVCLQNLSVRRQSKTNTFA